MKRDDEVISPDDAPPIGAEVEIVSPLTFPNGKRFTQGERAWVVAAKPHGAGAIVTLRTEDGRELPTLTPGIFRII